MGKIERFECDATGEVRGHKTDGLHFDVRAHCAGDPFEIRSYDVFLCGEALEGVEGRTPTRIDHVGINDEGEIVGAAIPTGFGEETVVPWCEPGEFGFDQYERFWAWVEQEVSLW
jgi:hypothetical protein